MNKQRRKDLEMITIAIEELKEQLEAVLGDEEEYRDNMPENLHGSERYENAETVCEYLSDAVSNLEEAANNITEAVE